MLETTVAYDCRAHCFCFSLQYRLRLDDIDEYFPVSFRNPVLVLFLIFTHINYCFLLLRYFSGAF